MINLSLLSLDQKPPLFKTIVCMRILWALFGILLAQHMIGLGTATGLLFVASACGITLGSLLANSNATSLGIATLAIMATAASSLLTAGVNYILEIIFGIHFFADSIGLHIETCLGIGLVSAILTWGFWRIRSFLYVEALTVCIAVISLCSGHRNFHLDQPKIVTSLAWYFGVNNIYMLITVGIAFATASIAYLYCASVAIRPRTESGPVLLSISRKRFAILSILALVFLVPLLALQSILYGYYHQTMQTRIANGVGMESKEGVSPLSFQSALGSSNQPAALVRLEGDYTDNPFIPMLYLRENALSQFNGKELVFAGRGFDSDLPTITTSESFSRTEDSELLERTPIIQSIYTLADHNNAFAIDYPVSIVQLKNPRPKRFKSSYRAYSIAPAYPLRSLSAKPVGDPRWTPEIRAHFTQPHSDTRYGELAKEITRDAQTPIDKMTALTDYLSRTAIYTLTPNHTVEPHEDPVAPFLFGDHRGYCVHFAHALVYMARSLGLPARIGTGYLTDLSQARDGHILLRMSDRHAWAEVFIQNIGWTPFDVQPDQVESHAETEVDAKLLEELMGILEPGEEILPNELTENEPGMSEDDVIWLPSKAHLYGFIAALLGLGILVKVSIRRRWKFTSNPGKRVRWSYISVSSVLLDMNYERILAETTTDFACRAPVENLASLSKLLNQVAFNPRAGVTNHEIDQIMNDVQRELQLLPFKRKLLIALNPRSISRTIVYFIGGGRW